MFHHRTSTAGRRRSAWLLPYVDKPQSDLGVLISHYSCCPLIKDVFRELLPSVFTEGNGSHPEVQWPCLLSRLLQAYSQAGDYLAGLRVANRDDLQLDSLAYQVFIILSEQPDKGF